MPYLQKNRHNNKKRNLAFTAISIFILGSLVFSFTSGIFLKILNPIWTSQNKLSYFLWNKISLLNSKKALIEENNTLKEKILNDSQIISSFNSKQSTYDNLLQILGRSTTTTGILGSVLVRPPQTPYDTLIIDAGEREGVEVGNTASLLEGGNIGIVSETFNNTSRIKLYSTSEEKTNAVLERGNVPVNLVGLGGGVMEFVLSREIEVKNEDRIISSNIDSNLLGTVENIEVAPTDSFKKVLVRSSADLYNIRFVKIIK